MDELGEILGNFLFVALFFAVLVAVALFVGLFLLPIGLAGAGTLYYISNVRVPEKRRREARERLELLFEQAAHVAPKQEELRDALFNAGITSDQLHDVAMALFRDEGLTPPPLPPIEDDPIEVAKYVDGLQAYLHATNAAHFDDFKDALVSALQVFEPAEESGSKIFKSSRELTRAEIERLMLQFVQNENVFTKLQDTINENWRSEGEKYPTDCKHEDYAWRYLKGTPLLPLAHKTEWVGLESRMYHTYLLGSSGSGKTNLIENIIAHDLASEEDCCIVVIDSQTQLIEKLAALDIEETTYITPRFELALNLFDVGYEEMKGQGIEGETLINKTIGLLSFIMEGMMGTEFSSPQRTLFQYAIQLTISIKGGNIFTFMDVLSSDGHKRYQNEINLLDANTQRFFNDDFGSAEYRRSREAIRRRVDGLLMNPTFRRLFSATENKIDMLEEMEHRRLVLIDTNKPMLDTEASAFFGRMFIAMIVRAAHRRFAQGKNTRPVYLIVDEAHEYFDSSISDMLEQARKANIGLLVSHQSLSQAKRKNGVNIVDPLMVNTATKIIWTSYKEDAAKFASSMQISASDILNLPQYTFGMHTRKDGFVPITSSPSALSGFERRTNIDDLHHKMEALYGRSRDAQPTDRSDGSEESARPTTKSPSLHTNEKEAPPKLDPEADMI